MSVEHIPLNPAEFDRLAKYDAAAKQAQATYGVALDMVIARAEIDVTRIAGVALEAGALVVTMKDVEAPG